MSKKNRKPVTAENTAPAQQKMSMITFGNPERAILNPLEYEPVYYDSSSQFYTLPVNRLALAELPDINGQHGGILRARTNMITADFVSGGGMVQETIQAAVLNLLTFGDVALLKLRNAFGKVIGLHPLPSLYLRRGKDQKYYILQKSGALTYAEKDIVFIKLYDTRQQVYGKPDYLGGIHSAMLNNEATIFRRRYYKNGAHLGYILYTTDPNMTDEMEDEMKKQIAAGKGVGNFKSMMINIPNGKEKGVQLLPVSDMTAKDEFVNIKNISMQDILNAHRFPPGLAGMMPNNNSSFPDITKTRDAYQRDEVTPVQKLIRDAVNNNSDIPANLRINFTQLTPIDA
ncbi:phage portal protein [Citrobacter portucalensis]|uniref:phage portal protein n=1 Tax=Citrobacter portucalensis TaxID=1639133 RepID=UPI00226B033B|nr:phage portal protein [Citrobacter portucalensis]MCX9039670.1 phage portal protein [Citrobacter portucalensis]